MRELEAARAHGRSLDPIVVARGFYEELCNEVLDYVPMLNKSPKALAAQLRALAEEWGQRTEYCQSGREDSWPDCWDNGEAPDI